MEVDSVMENGEVISGECILKDKMKINSEMDSYKHDKNVKIAVDKDENHHSEVYDLNDSFANI